MEWLEVLDKLSDKLGVLAILVIGYLIMRIKDLASRVEYLEDKIVSSDKVLSDIRESVSYIKGRLENSEIHLKN